MQSGVSTPQLAYRAPPCQSSIVAQCCPPGDPLRAHHRTPISASANALYPKQYKVSLNQHWPLEPARACQLLHLTTMRCHGVVKSIDGTILTNVCLRWPIMQPAWRVMTRATINQSAIAGQRAYVGWDQSAVSRLTVGPCSLSAQGSIGPLECQGRSGRCC